MFNRLGFGPAVSAFNPRGRSKLQLLRVVTIWLILVVRTIHVAVYVARCAINNRKTGLIVGCIFGILGTLFVPLALGQIAAAQGKRRVLGINWGRLHFDVILGLATIASFALMILTFITSGRTRNNGLFSAWCIVWVILSLFSIIAARPDTSASYV